MMPRARLALHCRTSPPLRFQLLLLGHVPLVGSRAPSLRFFARPGARFFGSAATGVTRGALLIGACALHTVELGLPVQLRVFLMFQRCATPCAFALLQGCA